MLESDYIHAAPPKPPPPIPVRVSRRSQLTAALRQHARPIVIEDQELARPFARLLRARQLRLWALGEFIADTMKGRPHSMARCSIFVSRLSRLDWASLHLSSDNRITTSARST